MPEIGEIRKPHEIGYKGTIKHIFHACIDCGQPRWVRFLKGKPENQRCAKCVRRFTRSGSASNLWKGGTWVNGGGYIMLKLQPNDEFFYSMANKKGYVLEHRLVVAKALGRCLHSWELVHHKGAKYPKGSIENKQDNRYPENLQIVTDDRHTQITILENKIKHLEQRVTLLEAENVALKAEQMTI